MNPFPKFFYFLFLVTCSVYLLSCEEEHPTTTSSKQRTPGHYVAVSPSFNLAEINHFEEPTIQGVNKRYFWRTLEPKQGKYDFSAIEEDLAYCQAHGKQLIVFLCDRAFWIKGAMPTYLQDIEYEHEEGGGFSPIRWHPMYLERFLAIGEALAEQFDAHPHFEGIAIQETALDLPEDVQAQFDFTPEKYQAALRAILDSLSTSFTNSQIFWYQNGIQGTNKLIREIADSIAHRDNVIMGGPDILPHRRWLRHTYKIYDDYQDKMTLFCSVQDDSYHHHKNDLRLWEQEPIHEEGYLSMEDIFLYGRDSMHLSYVFWNEYYEGQGEGHRSFEDAIEVIRKYPLISKE